MRGMTQRDVCTLLKGKAPILVNGTHKETGEASQPASQTDRNKQRKRTTNKSFSSVQAEENIKVIPKQMFQVMVGVEEVD